MYLGYFNSVNRQKKIGKTDYLDRLGPSLVTIRLHSYCTVLNTPTHRNKLIPKNNIYNPYLLSHCLLF